MEFTTIIAMGIFDTEVLGIPLLNLIMFFLAVGIGIILSFTIPWIARFLLSRVVSRRMMKEINLPISRFLMYSTLVITIAAAISLLGYNLHRNMSVFGARATISMFIWYLVTIIVIWFFGLYILPMLLRGVLRAVMPRTLIHERPRMVKSIMRPIYALVAFLSILIILDFFPEIYFRATIRMGLVFLIIVSMVFLVGRVLSLGIRISLSHSAYWEKHDTTVIERITKWTIYMFGFAYAFSYIGVDLWAIATSLGLIGFAVAFGLQETIADIAAGFIISIEKPFKIGDRIVVDVGGSKETYGDVLDIGFRSTKVKTIEGQIIYIPNSIVANQMIWNMTKDSERVIVRVPVSISYDSDWRLAERLMIDTARSHPLVSKDVPPKVLLREFGDSGIIMELWCTIEDARSIFDIKSDLMKKIKDEFDEFGVEIPFNYHTLTWKKELPKPKTLDDVLNILNERMASNMPGAPERPRLTILVPSAGAGAAKSTYEYIKRRFTPGDKVIILYVNSPRNPLPERKIRSMPGIRGLMGLKRERFEVELVIEKGPVVETILRVARDRNADIIVMGSSLKSPLQKWVEKGKSVVDEVTRRSSIPTVVVPYEMHNSIKK